jgi:hypothetical protein
MTGMTNQPDSVQPPPAAVEPPPVGRHPQRLGRIVLIWSAVVLFVVGAGIANNWQSNRALDSKVDRGIARSHRIETAVDSVRQPLCTILYVALSRPAAGLTSQQVEARVEYYRAYGPGTGDQPGLNCPKPLPQVR